MLAFTDTAPEFVPHPCATDPVLRSSKFSRRFVAAAALGEQFPVHFPNQPVDNAYSNPCLPLPAQMHPDPTGCWAAVPVCRFCRLAGWAFHSMMEGGGASQYGRCRPARCPSINRRVL